MGTQAVERHRRAVRSGRAGVGYRRVVRFLQAPPQPATVVDAAVPGDAEQPDPEPGQVAVEAGQVAGSLQPRLGGHVIGGVADDDPQVPQHRGLECHPQRLEAGLVAATGGGEGGREVGVLHGPIHLRRVNR